MLTLKDISWNGPDTFEDIITQGIAPLMHYASVIDSLDEANENLNIIHLNQILADYLESLEQNLYRLKDECEAALKKETAPQDAATS